MKKLLETLFSTANNRIRNPFIGSFIFSWIVFNWKPISYFLFSEEKTRVKIVFIEETYENIWNAVLFPLIFSLFYVLILPYLNQFIQSITFKAEKEKRKKEQELKIENIGYLQVSAEKEKVLEDIRSGNRDIAQLNERITLLEDNNIALNNTNREKDKLISDYQKEIEEIKLKQQKIRKNSPLSEIEFERTLSLLNEYFEFKKNNDSKIFLELGKNNFSGSVKIPRSSQQILSEFGVIDVKDGQIEITEKGKDFLHFGKGGL